MLASMILLQIWDDSRVFLDEDNKQNILYILASSSY